MQSAGTISTSVQTGFPKDTTRGTATLFPVRQARKEATRLLQL